MGEQFMSVYMSGDRKLCLRQRWYDFCHIFTSALC